MSLTLDRPSDAEPSGESTDPPAVADRSVRRLMMRPRRALVKVHRWLSIGLLGWLIVISFTGAWLVESHAIEGWTNHDRYETTPGDRGADAAIAVATHAAPDDATLSSLTMPGNGRGVYQVSFEVPVAPLPDGTELEPEFATYFVDPGSAAVNDVATSTEGWTWWLYRGHMYLWQDHGVFGVFDPVDGWCRTDADGNEPGGAGGVVCDVIPTGDDMVAWFALGWMVVLLTGLYLWYWPGVRRWATAFVIRRDRGRFAFHMSVHKAVGLVVWVPLVVVAFTGAAFAFPKMNDWYSDITPATADFALWEFPEDLASAPGDNREPITAEAAVAAIEERFPEVSVDSISPPVDDTGYYAAWVTRGFSPWSREGGGGNVYVAVDQYTGEVIDEKTPEEGNVFDQAWGDWSFPLHTGDFGGPFSRFAYVFVGLAPLALGLTGLSMNLIRRAKRRARRG